MSNDRFDRNLCLFGREGQERIAATRIAVVGIGGLGTHVIQQLALLGVREFVLIDKEGLAESNRNRYVGVRHDDPVGLPKVELGLRIIAEIDPAARVERHPRSLISNEAFHAVRRCSHVFGCLDRDGARFVLNELCAAYELGYLDLASDVPDPQAYGGRVCVTGPHPGCVYCYDLLDMIEVQGDLQGTAARQVRDAIYGVSASHLDQVGPAVVSLNGVVASLAVTEFMVGVTGMRSPRPLLFYRGSSGKVTSGEDPAPGCYYCTVVRGRKDAADLERYVRADLGL